MEAAAAEAPASCGSMGVCGGKQVAIPVAEVEEEDCVEPARRMDAPVGVGRGEGSRSSSLEPPVPMEGHRTSLPPHLRGDAGPMPRRRRCSISAESMDPSKIAAWSPPEIPKSDDARERIGKAIAKNFLFESLHEDQRSVIVKAMAEVTVAPGESVIKQGADGDYFYIVESGEFDIFVRPPEEPVGVGKKVAQVGAGGSFGELALMYNAQRAATVTAATDATLWAVDRQTFRQIIMGAASSKRRQYEGFLMEMPILNSLTTWERATLADALAPVEFADGETIIRQGEVGDAFYFVETGEGVCTKRGEEEGSPSVEVMRVKPGGYFGELALLTDAARAATVTAAGPTRCAKLGRDAFTRLMGPCEEILKRSMEEYRTYEDVIRESKLGHADGPAHVEEEGEEEEAVSA